MQFQNGLFGNELEFSCSATLMVSMRCSRCIERLLHHSVHVIHIVIIILKRDRVTKHRTYKCLVIDHVTIKLCNNSNFVELIFVTLLVYHRQHHLDE